MNGLALAGYALSNVRLRAGRSALVVLGFAATTALLFGYLLLRDALVAHTTAVREQMPELVVSRMIAGRPQVLALQDAEALRDLPSLGAVTPRVWGYLFSEPMHGTLLVVGHDGDPEALRPALGHGEPPKAEGEVVFGHAAAEALKVLAGDKYVLASPYQPQPVPMRVVGVLSREQDRFGADVALMSVQDARTLLGLTADQATDLALSVRNPAERGVLAQRITERLPGARVVDREALGRMYEVAFGWRSGFAVACMAPAWLALLLLCADRAAALGARERREVALHKAIGFSTREVLTVRWLESSWIALLGVVLGALLAYLWVFPLEAFGLRHALAGFAVLDPTLALTPATPPTTLVAVALVAIAPYSVLSVLSAWRVASHDPSDVLRG